MNTHATAVSASAGSWPLQATQVATALTTVVWARIRELGVIAVTGADATAFLQGQLTNDVARLGQDRVTLNGYCTAKGRLLATFRVWRDEQAIYLQLPSELLPGLHKRLSMFVLRAKATLVDDSSSWSTLAVFGHGAEARLREAFGVAPTSAGTCAVAGACRLMRLAGAPQVEERFLVIVPTAELAGVERKLEGLPEVPSGAFWWSEIDAAIPTVFAATQEKFVPQMINFEVVGGVNFKKGCYPGQEVVARSQYLGKLRRRMQRALVAGEAQAGADVFISGAEQPVGTVVMAASAPQGGTDLLFECPVERIDGTLHLESTAGPVLKLRGLPYEIFDVTA